MTVTIHLPPGVVVIDGGPWVLADDQELRGASGEDPPEAAEQE